MKQRLLQIGITGGIGSGKSTICKIFQQLGAPIYDADNRAKWILNNDRALKDQIIQAFGKESYDATGKYNRKYIASLVFNDPEKVALLNSIVHPGVGKDYRNWVDNANSQCGYIIKEAALMFESESYKMLDKVINVEASEEVRIKRIQKRDPFRKHEEIKGIIKNQWSDERRSALSDYIIVNDDSTLVTTQVLELDKIFRKLKESLA